ncbi:MAG TPA: AraC family transcriptional regulator [Polyangiaceae bacterium]|nr:AraC family transcriptional regulator [Polyangiaceae bacterium]
MPTIASGAIQKLIAAIEEMGFDPAPLLAEAGIDRDVAADRDARVPVERLHRLWDATVRTAPRAEAAVLGAERYSPGDYGLVGFVAMNSASLGEAMRHMVRYVGLWTDEPGMRLQGDGTLSIAYRSHFEDSPGKRLAMEAAAAEITNGARMVTQKPLTPREVRFAHRAPRDVSGHAAFFGCPVRFGQPDTSVIFRPEDMALPLPKADAQLGAFLREMANQALRERAGGEPSSIDTIREIVAHELQKGVPSLSAVARRMATSERTLRRRLEESGTSFRALLDQTRADLARQYVRDMRLPLSEVAFMLGFSEPSAFHRAFKRWTDTTPALWRARSAPGGDPGAAPRSRL